MIAMDGVSKTGHPSFQIRPLMVKTASTRAPVAAVVEAAVVVVEVAAWVRPLLCAPIR
jgi:hypothetical protein